MEYNLCKKVKSKIIREQLEKETGVKIKEIFIASSDENEMMFYLEKAKENHFTISESPSFSKTDDFSLYAITLPTDFVIKLDNLPYLLRLL